MAPSTLQTNFYTKAIDETVKVLDTDLEKGLSENEVRRRIRLYGLNQFAQKKHFQIIKDFLQSFANPLILLLIFASIISTIFGETRDAVLIIGIIFISGVVSFYQHYKAENEAEKLKLKVILTTDILRDGQSKEIPFSHVTVGDIILLSVGDIVPADCRLIEVRDLSIDESSLTGESFPVIKTVEPLSEGISLSQRTNIAFSGTHIISGEGKGIVVAIGTETEFGKLSEQIVLQKPQTAFDKDLNSFGFLIMKATLGLTLFVFLTNAFLRHDPISSFLFALALAVGLTPELLPVILTINLAKGAMKMSKKGVIVKYLPAIQNLGGMNILCTDKTGTLTENAILLQSYEDFNEKKDDIILTYGVINSNFHAGFLNPLDHALLAKKDQIALKHWEKIDEIPYDYTRKYMSVIVKEKKQSNLVMITKGAPHKLFPLITSYREGVRTKHATSQIRKKLENRYEALSSNGYRIIVVCIKNIEHKGSYTIKDETDLSFVGFLAFYDPPKKDVLKTIEELELLGISIKILTGDNELVTKKICEETQIPVNSILLGHEIDELKIDELRKRLVTTSICARLTPEQKAKVIKILKDDGNVVGYLGDGVNDAPPLKMADVGISVNNGSDIARDIADIILMKKNLHVLKEGVIEGRNTYGNILKYIMMETSSNFGNMITVAVSSLFLPFLPMLPIQLLLNNFLYDVSQLSIASDNVDAEFIKKPRKWDTHFIRNFMVIFGPISSLFDFVTFFVLFFILHASAVLFHTGWFIESLVTQALIIFSIRTRIIPFYKSQPSRMLALSSLIVCLLGIIIVSTPLGSYFQFSPLPFVFYEGLVIIVILYFLIVEATKTWFYRSI